MPMLRIFCLVAGLVALTGCHRYGCLVKRESEQNCPTDIRQTIPWCAGEDAVFQCPCRPAHDFYGHRPPGWHPWPTSGAEWRDAYGAFPVANSAVESGLVVPESESTNSVPLFDAPKEIGHGAERSENLPPLTMPEARSLAPSAHVASEAVRTYSPFDRSSDPQHRRKTAEPANPFRR
jgi:hypothetical protein